MSIWAHISHTYRRKTVRTPLFYKKNNDFIKLIYRNFKVKIFDLTVEFYCKVKNLNFQISLNQPDTIIFLIIQRCSSLVTRHFWLLTPDSWLLTPDSWLLTPDLLAAVLIPVAGAGHAAAQGTLAPGGDTFWYDTETDRRTDWSGRTV